MIQQTSINAFRELNLNKRQEQVYQWLKYFGPATNTMIANSLKLPINSITPRVCELRKKGKVTFSHKGKCPVTKKQVMWWKIII